MTAKFRVERGVVRERDGIRFRMHVARAEFNEEKQARPVFDEGKPSLQPNEYMLLQKIDRSGKIVHRTIEDVGAKP